MFSEPFYKARTIGDNIDVTFGFIRENFKTVLKTVMVFSIPLCIIIEGLYVFGVIQTINEYEPYSWADELSTWKTMGIVTLVAIAINLLTIMPLALSLININYNRKGGTEYITMKEAWKYIKPNIGKCFKMPFAQVALFLIFLFIIILTTGKAEFLLYALLAVLFFIIMSNCLPAYCIGKHPYSTSMSKGISYGFTKLFVILAFSFIMLIVTSLIFLWEIAAMELLNDLGVEFLGTDVEGNIVAYIVFWLIMAILWALITISINIALTATTVGMAYQYGSFEEKTCHIELKKKIENFDNLKES